MPKLIHQRCLNHYQREAAARCTGCGEYFCRECISEHHARLLCAACLRKAAEVASPRSPRLAMLAQVGQWLAALVIAWLFFYVAGECLLALPDSFHEGTLWKAQAPESK